MQKLDFKGKKITIMGLGLHGGGLEVTRFLARAGAILTVTDLKTAKQLAPTIKKLKNFKIRYVLGRHKMSDFTQVDMIIQNPDVPRGSEFLLAAQKHNVAIETDLSLFLKVCPTQEIIGVTGTKGKSTTTTLIYNILKRQNSNTIIGGNIRISPLEFLSKINAKTRVVLELSSWQLEGLGRHKLSPKYAVVTNVLRDHLNTYKDMSAYAEAKALIFKSQKPTNLVVLNYDNNYTRKMAKHSKSQIAWYSGQKLSPKAIGSFIEDNWIVFQQGQKKIKVVNIKDVKLLGEHNLSNVLAAVTLAVIYGVPLAIISQTIKNFKGIDNRLQLIREYKGIKYYNDTTATTPDATMAALQSFTAPVVLVAGGKDKNLEFSALAKTIKKSVKALVLLAGTATDKLLVELKAINYKKDFVIVDSMAKAIIQAQALLKRGDVCLLSPGAASFGLFLNEFDRGDQFNQQVKKIK